VEFAFSDAGPELTVVREARKLHDAEWAAIVNILTMATSLEPAVIDVATAAGDEKEPFIERSRNEILDDAINNICSKLMIFFL
jgi:hypothetical protein